MGRSLGWVDSASVLGRINGKRTLRVRRYATVDTPSARRRWGVALEGEGRTEKAMLRIYGVILEVVGELRPVIQALERRDSDLARQMRRAASSVALNTAEGMYSLGKNRRARYHNALGSMRETLACIEVGTALGYLDSVDDGVVDRIRKIIATLVRLVGK